MPLEGFREMVGVAESQMNTDFLHGHGGPPQKKPRMFHLAFHEGVGWRYSQDGLALVRQ